MPLPIVSPSSDHRDRVAGLEGAAHRRDADRQQARSLLAQHPRRARVDHHLAARGLRVFDPQLEARGARRRSPRSSSRPAPPPPRRRASRARSRCRSPPASPPPSPSARRRPWSASRPSRSGEVPAPISSAPSSAKSSTREISFASGFVRGSPSSSPSMLVSRTSNRAPSSERDLGGEEVVVAEVDLVGRGRVVLVDRPGRPPSRAAGRRVWRAFR